MARNRTNPGLTIGLAAALLAGCSKQADRSWKQALDDGDVIHLPKSVADSVSQSDPGGAPVETFVVPSAPPLEGIEPALDGSSAQFEGRDDASSGASDAGEGDSSASDSSPKLPKVDLRRRND